MNNFSVDKKKIIKEARETISKIVSFADKVRSTGKAFKFGIWLESLTDDEVDSILHLTNLMFRDPDYQNEAIEVLGYLSREAYSEEIYNPERDGCQNFIFDRFFFNQLPKDQITLFLGKLIPSFIRLETARRMGMIQLTEPLEFKLDYKPKIEFKDPVFKKLYESEL